MAARILLVEDDPVTSAYLSAAIATLPAEVDAADSVAAALALADRHTYALWLIDANLPDGSGAALLARLRESNRTTPALAHTATPDRAAHDALIAAGFAATLTKPMTAATLHDAIRRALLPIRPCIADAATLGVTRDEPTAAARDADASLPVWDDAAAMRALNGQRNHVDALRALFVGELPAVRASIRDAVQRADDGALRAALHRLRASGGFVGAARLSAAVGALHDAPDSVRALAAFDAACQEVLSPP
ncbi:MAG: response regulator [Luteimonas sp.]